MEHRTEKNLEHEMETGTLQDYVCTGIVGQGLENETRVSGFLYLYKDDEARVLVVVLASTVQLSWRRKSSTT